MEDRNLDYSSSEGESALSVKAAENQRRNGLLRNTSPAEGSAEQHDEAEEFMLSEFLVSLQHIADVPSVHNATASSHVGGSGEPSQHAAPAFAPATARPAPARRTVVHRRKRRDDLAGPCNHCGALSSPQWRKGPKGKPVLCNACGIRFLRNRTLTKVMPKKRRAGSVATGGKRIRAAVVAAADEDDEDEDGLMEDTMTATGDFDAAYSAAAAVGYAMPHELHQQQQQLLLQHNLLAATESALFCLPSVHEAAASSVYASQQHQLPTGASPFAAHAANTMNASAECETAPMAVGASAELLLGCSSTGSRGSARSLLAHLGDCPSLSLALVLHQQQQQRRQQEGRETQDELQQQQSSYLLPKCPELQLFPPHSPAGGSSGTRYAGSPSQSAAQQNPAEASIFQAAIVTSTSPHSTTSGLMHRPSQGTTAAQPLSPLFLEPRGATPTAAAAGTAEAKSADILQLVQQLGSALGGIGPAVELLRFCSGNPTALSAAVAAMAASLRTETAQ